MAMLEARDIHVRFGDRVVLEDISFAVEPGELHGIMGPNGAGKTTFFNVLTGRVKPRPRLGAHRRRGRDRPCRRTRSRRAGSRARSRS